MKNLYVTASIAGVLTACYLATQMRQTPRRESATRTSALGANPTAQPGLDQHLHQLDHFSNLCRLALAHKQFKQAENLARQAIEIMPDNPASWLLLAEAYEGQGKDAEAITAYRQIINNLRGSSIASDPTTSARFVLTLLRNNQYQEAAQVFNKAMDESALPFIPDAVKDKAQAAHDTRLLKPYVQKYAVTNVRFDPAETDETGLQAAAHYVLGVKTSYYVQGAEPSPLSHLQEAVRLQPRWGQAQLALAQVLERQHRLPEAEAAYARALTLNEPGAQARKRQQQQQQEEEDRRNAYNMSHGLVISHPLRSAAEWQQENERFRAELRAEIARRAAQDKQAQPRATDGSNSPHP